MAKNIKRKMRKVKSNAREMPKDEKSRNGQLDTEIVLAFVRYDLPKRK
jgi:hypothetical protein